MNNTYEIFFASDNNYAQHLCVAIASILKNSKEEECFNFYILDSNISEENKTKIKNLSKIKEFDIEFIKVDQELFKDCPHTLERITLQTYYRYIIPKIKPNLDKVLYLDSDIVILDSLSDLWNISLNENYGVVVEDLNKNSSPKDAKRLGLKNYFNAGVLLINNKKWIEDNISQKLFDNTAKLFKEGNLIWQDQDALNYTFQDRVIFASPRFNLQQAVYRKPLISKYTKNEIKEAKNNICILHYSNQYKPWNNFKQNESFEHYWKYLQLTDFWNDKQENLYFDLKKDYLSLNAHNYNILKLSKIENAYDISILGFKTKIKLFKNFSRINKHVFNFIPSKKLRRKLRNKYYEIPKTIERQIKTAQKLDSKYVNKYLSKEIPNFQIKTKKEFKDEKIIWQYWGQGIDEKTPEIIKICFESVNKFKNEYKQIILTNETIKDYIDLPDFVYKKLENKTFSYAFFSDLLRVCLLSTYGGIWIDATIYLTGNINQEFLNQNFFSFQRTNRPKDFEIWQNFNNSYFVWNNDFKINWLSSFIVAKKNNCIVNALKDILINFWENEKNLEEYFTAHFIYDSLIKYEPYKNTNKLLISDLYPHLMQLNMNKKYSKDLWENITSKCNIHKLCYKNLNKLKKKNNILKHILKKDF